MSAEMDEAARALADAEREIARLTVALATERGAREIVEGESLFAMAEVLRLTDAKEQAETERDNAWVLTSDLRIPPWIREALLAALSLPTTDPAKADARFWRKAQENSESAFVKLANSTKEIEAALKECSDDLESWVENHYENTKNHGLRRQYERDMEPVRRARALLRDWHARPDDAPGRSAEQ